MRELLAGDGGSVLVAAALNQNAVALACEGLAGSTTTPSGVSVHPADELPDDLDVDLVALLPCEVVTRSAVMAWASARGLPVEQRSVPIIDIDTRVVAVSACTTGSGKTALVRRVVRGLSRSGVNVAVARHPMAELLSWGRFEPQVIRSPQQLAAPRPITEREELAPVVGTGAPVVVGLDAERVARLAASEAGDGVVVWDGGGAAEPWLEPTMHLVAVDLLRRLPDDANARIASAHAVVLTKADSASADRAREVEAQVRSWNADASIVLADLAVGVQPTNVLADKRVVVVEDANSLLLGGLRGGAGAVAARRFRCGVVDPRPFAVGALADVLRGSQLTVIPALGRNPQEIDDLAATVYATPGDAVLWASNADPSTVIGDEQRPIVRAYGELTEVAGPPLQEVYARLIPGHG